jgi:hypothetical protein
MDKTHQINNSLTKIKVIYDLLRNSDEEDNEECIKHLESELEKIKSIFHSLRCNS